MRTIWSGSENLKRAVVSFVSVFIALHGHSFYNLFYCLLKSKLFRCQISDDICRLFFGVFYLNKLSFGKTFICKVERLNVK